MLDNRPRSSQIITVGNKTTRQNVISCGRVTITETKAVRAAAHDMGVNDIVIARTTRDKLNNSETCSTIRQRNGNASHRGSVNAAGKALYPIRRRG